MDGKKEMDCVMRMMVGDYNDNHDPDTGRFTEGGSGGSGKSGKNEAEISSTSTHGKFQDLGGGQWYAENDNGSSCSILDAGKDDYNLWKYGSKQIYEVQAVDKDGNWKTKERFSTKKEAMRAGKEYIKSLA